MNKALAPNPEAREEGKKVQADWAEDLRPRRSDIRDVILGKRPNTAIEQGIYKVTWHDPAYILLEFDYITNSRSSGDVHAELTILVNAETGPGHYQKTRLNLLADRSVVGLASSLEKRMPELKIPWQRYLNDAVQWVLMEYRSGEPAVVLTEAPEPEGGGASLLHPILASDGMTLIFGDGGAGKSMLLLSIAASLHSGLDVIPGLQPSKKVNVAYLDWEWSAWKHRQRLERLWTEFDGDPPGIIYVPCRLSLREERDRIRRVIRDHNIGHLAIDSVGMAAGGAPEEAETAIGFFGALRELGLSSTGIAHVNRTDAKGSADKPFGSAYWHNTARATWYLKRSEQMTTDGSVPVALFHRKSNEDRLHPPIGLSLQFDERGTRITRSKAALDEPDLNAALPTRARIVLLLKAGPLTIRDIAEQVGADAETVRKALQRGPFQKLPGGGGEPDRWGLAVQE